MDRVRDERHPSDPLGEDVTAGHGDPATGVGIPAVPHAPRRPIAPRPEGLRAPRPGRELPAHGTSAARDEDGERTTPRPRTGPLTLHDFTATTIDGAEQDLSIYRGRVVLVVNTATRCALTPQLEGLQTLQRAFADHGFTVLGFPSDQFHQDPGTDEEIAKICTSAYDISFPLFSKVDVNGAGSHPLWAWLREQKGGVMGGRIAWNFTKFLVDAEGRVLRRFAPPVPPVRIARRIETELGLAPGSTPLG